MNKEKRTEVMLNISSWLMAAYCVLFLGCYALLYEPWKNGWLDGAMGLSFPTEVPRIFSPAIILSALAFSAATVVLCYLLKKRSESGLCIGAAAFAGCAFAVDRLIKGIVPMIYNASMTVEGTHGVVLAGYHANAVRFLDLLLLPLFAVSLTLMVCVCYNKRCERGRA